MYAFDGMTLSLKNSRTLFVLFCALLLSACDSTRTFQDAGAYKGENYTIGIERVDTGLFRAYNISINGDKILTIDKSNVSGDQCQKMSFYVSRCTYNTKYKGKAVRVIQEIDAQMFQQNAYYSVYFDGVLIRRVTTPLL
jgi:hypothetical protein